MAKHDRLASDSAIEQNRKYELALYYTKGDKDKAKDMLAGTYRDLYAIKTIFSATNMHGGFLMFFNIPYSTFIDAYTIISNSFEVSDLESHVPWREFEQNIEILLKKCKIDKEHTMDLKDALSKEFTFQFGSGQLAVDLKEFLDDNNGDALHRIFTNLIQDNLGYQIKSISVDYQNTSSLTMELYSASSKKVTREDIKKAREEQLSQLISQVSDNGDIDEELKGKHVKLILDGKPILAPINGRPISEITVGERIKVILDSSNAKALIVARAFKSYNEKEKTVSPMSIRVVSIKQLIDGGYKVFGIIAKGIYAKIVEEEENLKIAMLLTPDEEKNEYVKSKKGKNILIYMIIIIAVLVLVGVLIIILR